MSNGNVFMFAGQGSQYFGMGRELRSAHPVFARSLRELGTMFADHGTPGLLDELYRTDVSAATPFDALRYTHPALAALQLALFDMLVAEDIVPDCLLGYSLGESVAACAAGVLDRERLVACLSEQVRLVERHCPEGAMLAVLGIRPEDYDPAADEVELAAINYDEHFVLSGRPEAIARAGERLRAAGATCPILPVRYAFHTADMDRIGADYLRVLAAEPLRQPEIRLMSCAASGFVADPAPDDLWRMFRAPIMFRDAVRLLEQREDGLRYVDLSPSGTLAGFAARDFGPDSTARTFPLLDRFAPVSRRLEEVRALRPKTAARTPSRPPRTAVVFPGQGSQQLGMADELFDEFPDLRAQADEILGYSVAELCREDAAGNLGRTEFTQPALFVANALYYRAWEREHGPANFFAGHSLGEYNALWAAGAFDFATGLRLVRARGRLMAAATGGGMAAIVGKSESAVRAVLADHGLDLDIANFNAPDQLVLSGPEDVVARAQDAFTAAGARFVRLRVSGAFHSRWMAGARAEFERFLAGVELRPPTRPVISNVTARAYPDADIRPLLLDQLTSPVRWEAGMRHLLDQGVGEVVETGPGRVLTGLLGKIRAAADGDVPVPFRKDSAAPASVPTRSAGMAVAVVGIGCRMPGARDHRRFFANLRAGVDSVREVPADRFDASRYYDPDITRPDRSVSKWLGVLDDPYRFDHEYFGLTPRDARLLDPLQRLLLEETQHCLDDAGITAATLAAARTAVYIGNFERDHLIEMSDRPIESHSVLGVYDCLLANRLSDAFDLTGASVSVDAACASSLVAIHLGAQALETGETDYVLAGGVNLSTQPWKYIGFSKARMLSPGGRCKTFDRDADGFVPGDGVGVVLLRRLDDAVRDGDHIYGVIRGTAVNHSGSRTTITAPTVAAERSVVAAAVSRAGVDPRAITYVETHGTGTALGDPIEVEALRQVFAPASGDTGWCALGSVKSNIGHLEGAAGVAGLIKVLMMMQRRRIVPTLHVRTVNPLIDVTSSPFRLALAESDWLPAAPGAPLCAGVSSFGFGGVNSHIVVEEYVGERPANAAASLTTEPGARQPFLLSAHTPAALDRLVTSWRQATGADGYVAAPIADICKTLATGRTHQRIRLAGLVASYADIDALLSAASGTATAEPQGWALEIGLLPLPSPDELESLLAAAPFDEILTDCAAGETPAERAAAIRAELSQGGERARSRYTELIVRALLRLGLRPDLVVPIGAGIRPTLAALGCLDSPTAVESATGATGQSDLRPPAFPVLVPATGRVVHPIALDRDYLAELAATPDPAPATLTAALDLAIRLAGQRTLRQYLHDWQRVLDERGLADWTVRDPAAVASKTAFQPRETLILTVAFQHALRRLTSKWSLPLARLDADERVMELVDLLLDDVLTPAAVLDLLLGGADGLAAAAARADRDRVDLAQPDRYPVLRRRHAFPTGLRDPRDWVESNASTADFAVPDGLSVVRVGARAGVADPAVSITGTPAADPLTPALLELWRRGVDIDWSHHPVGSAGVTVPLPTTEFDGIVHRDAPAVDEPQVIEVAAEWVTADSRIGAEPGPVLIGASPTQLHEIRGAAAGPAKAASAAFPAVRFAAVLDGAVPDTTIDAGTSVVPLTDSDAWDRALDTTAEFGAPVRAVILVLGGLEGPAAALQAAKAAFGLGVTILAVGRHDNGSLPPDLAALSGMARTLRRETDGVRLRVVALGGGLADPATWAVLADEAARHDGGDLVRHHLGIRATRRFVPLPAAAPHTVEPSPDGDVYVITGGLGRIGRLVAAHMLRRPGVRVALVGRTPEGDVSHVDLTSDADRVGYFSGDISDPAATGELLDRVRSRFGPVTGVFHAAGVLRDRNLVHKPLADLRDVLAPKVLGAINLDRATRDDPLRVFVLFSSMVATVGNPGQADYATANAYLDEFASAREVLRANGSRRGRSVSIGWPVWQEGGMAATGGGILVGDHGMRPMPSETGLAILDRLCATGSGAHPILHGDPAALLRLLELDSSAPKSTAPQTKRAVAETATTVPVTEMASVTALSRRYVRDRIAALRGVDPGTIDLHTGLDQLGLDSIVVSEFNATVAAELGPVSETLLFESRNLAAVADRIAAARPTELASRYGSAATDDNGSAEPAGTTTEPRTAVHTVAETAVRDRDIAVIGMAGRYPQAPDLDAFWRNLAEGRDSVTEVPADRWDSRDRPESRWGGFLTDVDAFDPLFFGISPRDAAAMDPQERLFLQTAWHALEDAGYPPLRLGDPDQPGARSVGVFVGVTTQTYPYLDTRRRPDDPMVPPSNQWAIANRVSYRLDLRGPSMPVDTACAAALTAIHLAAHSLVRGECEMALVGGVNLYLHPVKFDWLAQLRMLSPTGRCHTFGAAADGFVPGEGVGAVVLKPLRAALADGDEILGVIKGSAVGHGGRTSGFTVPNPVEQAQVVRRALADAEVGPDTIGYLEAHGTGTQLGDPIELSGLTLAFGDLPAGSCAIGSVKSNIGHLESAAGLAGLTKVLLQLRHGRLVPSLHSEPENPRITLADTPFRVNRGLTDWPPPMVNGAPGPRRAGISAFGAGGANAHVIVEEAPPREQVRGPAQGTHLVVVSATDRERLRAHCARLARAIDSRAGDYRVSELAYQLQVRREPLDDRLALLVEDTATLTDLLRAVAEDRPLPAPHRLTGTGTAPRPDDMWENEIATAIAARDLPALAALWVEGAHVPWERLYSTPMPHVRLPGYPFATERCWLPDAAPTRGSQAIPTPLAGTPDATGSTIEFTGAEPILGDHRVDDVPILPAVAYVEAVRAAANIDVPFRVRNTVWYAPIAVPQPRTVRVELSNTGQRNTFELTDRSSGTVHATGLLETSTDGSPEPLDIAAIRARCSTTRTAAEFYPEIRRRGLALGPTYQGITELRYTDDEALTELRLPTPATGHLLDPGMLDAALQASLWLLALRTDRLHLPYSAGSVEVHGGTPKSGYAHVVVRKSTPDGTKLDVSLADVDGRVLVKVTDLWLRPWQSAAAPDRAGSWFFPEWVAAQRDQRRDPGRTLIVASTPALGERLLDELDRRTGRRGSAVLATLGTEFATAGAGRYLLDPLSESDIEAVLAAIRPVDTVITTHPESFGTATDFDAAFDHAVLPMFHLIRALVRAGGTRRVRVVAGIPAASPPHRALGGLLRTATRESTRISHVLVELPDFDGESTEQLIAEALGAADGIHIRATAEGRDVRRWRRSTPSPDAPELRRGGVYLITGGVGGLGALVAEWLARTAGARVVLVGRSPQDARARAVLDRVTELGGEGRYIQADVSTAAGARAAVAAADTEFGALQGFFHCAAVLRDDYLVRQSADNMRAAAGAKAFGVVQLDAALSGRALEVRCLFSSAAAALGSVAQAPYAYANAFLDAYAEWCTDRGRRTVSIGWPLWADGGMRVDAEVAERLRAVFDMEPLDTDEGLAALGTAVRTGTPHLVYVPGDGTAVARELGADNHDDEKPTGTSEQQIPDTAVHDLVIADIADIAGLAPHRIRSDRAIGDYGFDSLSFGRLANQLSKRLNIDLTPALFFEYTTVRAVAGHLRSEYPAAIASALADTAATPAATTPTQTTTESAPPAKTVPGDTAQSGPEPIAIIGMHATLPGSRDPDEFWRHLAAGDDLVTEIPAQRWDWRDNYHPTPGPGRTNSRWGGFLPEVDTFDAAFFGITPREARLMDPQQRLFLQTAYRAIEEAGYRPAELAHGRTGLFVGVGSHDYQELLREAGVPVEAFTTTGMFHAILANRVSYLLDLKGPSFPIDTACSSSLVALRSAVESLRVGSCDTALVGGVNLLLAPMVYISFARAGMLSPTGRCRTFDAAADGYVRAEGVGALLLKPLSAAVRDGDHIHAVIRGSAVNHGGRVNTLTTPNPNAQADLIVAAFEEGGIDPATVGYLELHGTGTALGDPIEINGIHRAFRELRDRAGRPRLTTPTTIIGSVKSNMGHAEAAAGVAGIVKVILAMRHGRIPANLHLHELNPQIRLDGGPLTIADRELPWPRPRTAEGAEQPRRAGVSSFGFGGVNGHVLLEEYLPPATASAPSSGEQIFVLSARTPERLRAYAAALATACATAGDPADIAYTLQVGREPMAHRLAVVTASLGVLAAELSAFAETGVPGPHSLTGTPDPDAEPSDLPASDFAARWIAGGDVDWALLHRNRSPRRVGLPTYPFAPDRYWIPEDRAPQPDPRATGAALPLSSKTSGTASSPTEVTFDVRLSPDDPLIRDHVVQGANVVAGVVQLELAAAAVAEHRPELRHVVDLCWLRPLEVPATGTTVSIRLTETAGELRHEIRTGTEPEQTVHSTGRWIPDDGSAPEPLDPDHLASRCPNEIRDSDIYRTFERIGIDYGPAFRGIRAARAGEGSLLARVDAERPATVLDAALQAVTVLAAAQGAEPSTTRLPFAVDRVERFAEPPTRGYVHVTTRDTEHDVVIADESGRVCVRFSGVTIREAPDPLDGILYRPEWQAEPIANPGVSHGNWLIVQRGNAFGLAAALADRHDGPVQRLVVGTRNQRVNDDTWEIDADDPGSGLTDFLRATERIDQIWFLSALRDDPSESESTKTGALLLFRLVRALADAGHLSGVTLRAVVNDASDAAGRLIGNPEAAAVVGFTKSLAREYPRLGVNCVDIGVPVGTRPEPGELTRIIDALLTEPTHPDNRDVALADGRRLVRRLRPIPSIPVRHSVFRPGGHYVIFGGAGGIGLALAEYLAQRVSARLLLVGRGPRDQRIEDALTRLTRLGGQPEYWPADVTDADAVRAVIDKASASGRIHGVIHAAMVLRDGSVERLSERAFEAVLAPKVTGTRVLGRELSGEPLDFLLVLSSVQSFTGAAGQANYAAASTAQDALAHRLAARCDFPVHVVNWGPWSGVGRVASLEYQRSLRARGYVPLTPAEGMLAIERVLAYGERQVVVVRADRPVLDSIGVLETPAPRPDPVPRFDADPRARAALDDYIAAAVRQVCAPALPAPGENRSRADIIARLGAVPEHHPLVHALLDILTRHGLLIEDAGQCTGTAAAVRAPRPETLRADFPTLTAQLDLVIRCMSALPEVLAGTRHATEVLFPDGSSDAVAATYRTQLTDYCNAIVARRIADAHPTRVLEIGAGTGATTEPVLAALAAAGIDAEYDFTDISAGLLRRAERSVRRQGIPMRFRRLDIEKPTRPQGFESGSYDVVLAGNVLHATHDLDAVLDSVLDLLAPGGMLVLTEVTAVQPFHTVTFGLLDGWWRHHDEGRRLPGSPLLDTHLWRNRLEDRGFTDVSTLGSAAPEHLTQHVLTAHRPSGARPDTATDPARADVPDRPTSPSRSADEHPDGLVVHGPGTSAPDPRPVRAASPETNGDTRALEEVVRTTVTEQVAGCLGVPVDEIRTHTPLSDLGVDSIVAVELTNRLNDALGTTLKTIVVFDHPTVADLSDFIAKRHADRLTGLLPQQPTPAHTAPTNGSTTAGALVTPVAVRFEKPGHPRDLRVVPVEPVAPGPGEVEIRVRAFPINFSDFLFAKGLYPTMPDFPCTPGVEVSGVVARVGAGVTRFAVGDEVIALTGPRFGGQATLVVTDADFVVAKPPQVSHEQACGFPVAFLAMYLAFERAAVQPGDRVLIPSATGTNGLIAIQLARLAGAEVIATASTAHKIEYLRGLGITDAIDHRRTDVVSEVLRRTSGAGVDVVVNTQGGNAIQQGLDVLAPEGRYVETAVFGLQATAGLDLSHLVDNQSFHSLNTKKYFRRHPEQRTHYLSIAADHLARGAVTPTVAHIVPFDRIAEAYALKDNRDLIGRVVVTMPDPGEPATISHTDPASSSRPEEAEPVATQRFTASSMGERVMAASQHSNGTPPAPNGSAEAHRDPATKPPVRSSGDSEAHTPRTNPARDTDIAVIGMSGRFPGAADLDQFWRNLADGVCSIGPVPPHRWAATGRCREGGFLDDVSGFDARFFGLDEAEADFTDPQQRLFLEQSWLALEEAGYAASELRGRPCGVFVGAGPSQYLARMSAAGVAKPASVFWGNEASVLAGRIAYFLDLTGPTMTVNTACSSSLVALHLAVRSLLSGECETALAGGVFLTFDPDYFTVAERGGMLAADGRCKTFDAAADGFGPGEAVVALVLKPLSAALRDGDHIHGVIKGTAVNQDGRTNGLTAPSGRAQTRVVLEALDRAGVDPATLGYLEAHGTGTRLGDAIEIEALTTAFAQHTSRTGFCSIGTVKTNIGHTAAASGLAGVVKALLSMRHRQLPATLHLTHPNPLIDFDDTPFVVNTELRQWDTDADHPRRAAVSSFAFSGTNAHVVLEEAPHASAPEPSPRTHGPFVIPLSAPTPTALAARRTQLAQWLTDTGATTPLAHLAHHLQVHRDHFPHRAVFLAHTHEELHAALTATHPPASALPDIATAYLSGADVDWRAQWTTPGPRLSLPTYPFERKAHWYTDNDTVFGSVPTANPQSPTAAEEPAELSSADPAGVSPWEVANAAVLQAMSTVLARPHTDFDLNATHTDHGIDSVRAMAIVTQINRTLGDVIGPTDLFNHPDLRSLIDHAANRLAAAEAR
ncbi:ACP S-malonyltransferase [Nocardia sp. NPDC004068]|uniref:ACP S-malonyltransferase n=1 Tax=Nocardia sp. NPDC004068 TaxID=3364303 RepID=UPI003678D5E5